MDEKAATFMDLLEAGQFSIALSLRTCPTRTTNKQLNLKSDRIDYWLGVGAQPSDTVKGLVRRAKIDPTPGKKVAPAASAA